MCVQPQWWVQRRSASIYSNKSESCGGVFDSTLIKGVFVYYAGYSFPYQGRKVLIYYSLSGPQPVAGGTCIPLMQYYLQNVVKSWCTALKSPLLSCIIDPLHENTSLFSAWYTTDSEDVSVLFVSCQLQYHLQQHKGKVGNHPLFISLFRWALANLLLLSLFTDLLQETKMVNLCMLISLEHWLLMQSCIHLVWKVVNQHDKFWNLLTD